MIWIRADANGKIGMGHVMRCLSIAEALREHGSQVKFLLADDTAAPLIEAKDLDYEILHTSFHRMEEELPILRELAEEQKPKVCLIDSYFVTSDYLKRISRYCRTAYMDDKFSFPYPVDMVINYNIYGDMLPYRENAVSRDTVFLLGTAYAPLRKEFRERSAVTADKPLERVLITTGGSDPYYLAGQILEAAVAHEETEDLEYHVVSGAFNAHLSALRQLAEQNSRIHIHQNVTNMSELMRECDVAISAGGSTMYELCAVGIPIICFSFVDNQEKIVETFVERKLVCYGGNYLKEREQFAENVIRSLSGLMNDKVVREEYSRREQELVDGLGAERIAQALLGTVAK